MIEWQFDEIIEIKKVLPQLCFMFYPYVELALVDLVQ